MKPQGQIEAAACNGVRRFQQEYMGRGPQDIHAHLFRPEDRSTGLTQPDRFQVGGDPADRHFAALAHAAGGILITSDDHLL